MEPNPYESPQMADPVAMPEQKPPIPSRGNTMQWLGVRLGVFCVVGFAVCIAADFAAVRPPLGIAFAVVALLSLVAALLSLGCLLLGWLIDGPPRPRSY